MAKCKILMLLSTTAIILGVGISPISSMDSSKSTISTEFATLGGMQKKLALHKSYAELQTRSRAGDKAALEALNLQNPEQAILKYNSIVGAKDHLSKSESTVLAAVKKRTGGRDEELEKFAAHIESGGLYGEERQDGKIEQMLGDIDVINSKLDVSSPHEASILFHVKQYNQIRQAAGLRPVEDTTEMVHVTKKDAKTLIEKLAREIAVRSMSFTKKSIHTMGTDEAEKEPVSINQKLSLFTRNFPNLGETPEDDHLRDTALEEIMTLISLEPDEKQPIYSKLCFALEDFKTSPNYSHRLNKYAQYYEDQIKGGQFGKFYEAWEKEKDKIAKDQMLQLAGLCWNEIMDHVKGYEDVTKVYTSHDTPLLALIARHPSKVLPLLDISKIQSLQELIKYTPYSVIGGVYSALSRSGVKERTIPEGPSGSIVRAANVFLEALEIALRTGEQHARFNVQEHLSKEIAKIRHQEKSIKSEAEIHHMAEIETLKARLKAAQLAWDHTLGTPPEKFKNINFMISSSVVERFNDIPLTKLGIYVPAGAKKEEEELKKSLAFKLNQNAKAGYFGSKEEQEAAAEKQRLIDEKFVKERHEQMKREEEERKLKSTDTSKKREKAREVLMKMHNKGDKEDSKIVEERERKRKEQIQAQKAENARKEHILSLISSILKTDLEHLGISTLTMSFVNGEKDRRILFQKIFNDTKNKVDESIKEYIGKLKEEIVKEVTSKLPEAGEGAEAGEGSISTHSTPKTTTKTHSVPKTEVKNNPIDQETQEIRMAIEQVLAKVNEATGNDFKIESLTKIQVTQIKAQILKLADIQTMTAEDLRSEITREKQKTSGPKKYTNLYGPLNE